MHCKYTGLFLNKQILGSNIYCCALVKTNFYVFDSHHGIKPMQCFVNALEFRHQHEHLLIFCFITAYNVISFQMPLNSVLGDCSAVNLIVLNI